MGLTVKAANFLSRNQRGFTTQTVVLFGSVMTIISTALIAHVKDAKRFSEHVVQHDSERRMNESALQTVSQLITRGAIYYNTSCLSAEPQINGSNDYTKNDKDCDSIKAVNKDQFSCSGTEEKWRFERISPSAYSGVDCKQTGSDKKCAVVRVCLPSAKTSSAGINSSDRSVEVLVSFYEYQRDSVGTDEAMKVSRNIGYLRAQRAGKNADGRSFSTLNAKVNFGASDIGNVSLLGKHGATDTCFFMRPRTVSEDSLNRSFSAKSDYGKAYTLDDLEPRPDGKGVDEFSQSMFHSELTSGVDTVGEFNVLSEYTKKLIDEYYTGSERVRGARPVSSLGWSLEKNSWHPSSRGKYSSVDQVLSYHRYSGGRQNLYFVGVMPKLGAEGGPEFAYFLTSSKSHRKKWFEKNEAATVKGDLAGGCAGSAGMKGAAFCTKVNIPVNERRAVLQRRCKLEEISLDTVNADEVEGVNSPAPLRRYVDRAVQVSCDPRWIKLVAEKLEDEWSKTTNLSGLVSLKQLKVETTINDAIAALEVDDEFLAGEGIWKENPITGKGRHPIREAYDSFVAETMSGRGISVVDDYTIQFEGAKHVAEFGTESLQGEEGSGKPKRVRIGVKKVEESRTFKFYRMENLAKPVTSKSHVARTCGYFAYFNPESPTECKYSYVTKSEAQYVCRNNDGCFDERTVIRMADGSERLITRLKIGEFVYNPVTKRPTRIEKLTIGPEFKPLIEVSVGGRVVKVTDSHPFMTRRGWIEARNLKQGEDLLIGDGLYSPVTSLRIGEAGRTVANLALEGGADQAELHFVLADGVVTGDLVIQNMLQLRSKDH